MVNPTIPKEVTDALKVRGYRPEGGKWQWCALQDDTVENSQRWFAYAQRSNVYFAITIGMVTGVYVIEILQSVDTFPIIAPTREGV